ncbi:hypothetical protein CK203_008375 [Vitis vinifera]|uniref:Uncharacterized protein n=1 Tax=Vitis vinifera TaxID=29760 RepID=A0A438KP73_VITVI|nr:hypothetical protein CK203_008375 [Vitis vinifera]
MSDKTKVQALLKSHPSDNMRKGLKYLTQCARVWDPKHPAKTGLMPPYHWRHTPSLQARLLYRDMPPAHPWRGLYQQASRRHALHAFQSSHY